MFGCWQHQLWCGSTETTPPGRWDRSSEPVGGDDSAGNTLQLQGNKTEWKQWRHVYAEERNALQTFPALALHLLVSWYEVVQFRGLSWLQWRGIRGGLRELVGLRLLTVGSSTMVLFHRRDAHGFSSPFSPVIPHEGDIIPVPSPLAASWVVGHKNPRWRKCCCKDLLCRYLRDALCDCCISYVIFYKQAFRKQWI